MDVPHVTGVQPRAWTASHATWCDLGRVSGIRSLRRYARPRLPSFSLKPRTTRKPSEENLAVDVAYWPLADLAACPLSRRYRGVSGHRTPCSSRPSLIECAAARDVETN